MFLFAAGAVTGIFRYKCFMVAVDFLQLPVLLIEKMFMRNSNRYMDYNFFYGLLISVFIHVFAKDTRLG